MHNHVRGVQAQKHAGLIIEHLRGCYNRRNSSGTIYSALLEKPFAAAFRSNSPLIVPCRASATLSLTLYAGATAAGSPRRRGSCYYCISYSCPWRLFALLCPVSSPVIPSIASVPSLPLGQVILSGLQSGLLNELSKLDVSRLSCLLLNRVIRKSNHLL